MKHIMLDIETLDNKPSSVILSVAAVEFDPYPAGKNGKMFHRYLDIDSQIRAGRTVSAGTLMWWFVQNEGARMAQVNAKKRLHLADVLHELQNYSEKAIIWANSPMFDIAILNHAIDNVYVGHKPFNFRNQRDVRTIAEYVDYDEVKFTRPVSMSRHDALADCLDQIDIVRHFYQKFNIQPDEPEEE